MSEKIASEPPPPTEAGDIAPTHPDAEAPSARGAGNPAPPDDSLSMDELLRDASRLLGKDAADQIATNNRPDSAAQSAEEPSSQESLHAAIDQALEEAAERKSAAALANGAPAGTAAAPAGADPALESERDPLDAQTVADVQTSAAGPENPPPEAAAPEVATSTGPVALTDPGTRPENAPTAADDADDDFAAPEAVLAEAAQSNLPRPGDDAGMTAAELDAQLAAQARVSLEAEDAMDSPAPRPPPATAKDAHAVLPAPAPSAAPHPSPAQPPPDAPPRPSAPAPKVEARGPEAPKAVAAPNAPAESAGPDTAPTAPPLARLRSLAGQRAGVVLHTAATRYQQLGDGPRKVIRLSAYGTLVQAALIWGWLLFLRAPQIPATAASPAVHAATAADQSAPTGTDAAQGPGRPVEPHETASH